MGSNGPEEIVKSIVPSRSDSAQPWNQLAPDYERARSRDDSLDRLVEWPAQRACLGDVTGRSVLDLGCGNGGKLAELVRGGAGPSVLIGIRHSAKAHCRQPTSQRHGRNPLQLHLQSNLTQG